MNFPGARFHGWFSSPGNGTVAIVLTTLMVGAVAILLSLDALWESPAAWSWVVLGWAAATLTVRWWLRDGLTMPVVLIGGLLLRLVVLPFPPVLSDDAYRYLWDGLVTHLGDSPYRYLPSDPRYAELQHLVEFQRMNSSGFHSVYPPLSQVFFFLSASVRGLGFHAAFVLLKLLFGLIEFAGILAVARFLKPRDLMLYAWNPVVVLAILGQGHTETAMIGFLLLTIAAVHAAQPGRASLALAAAGWIKLVPFVLFPLLIARFGWKRTLPGILASAAGLLAFDAETLRHLCSSLKLYLSYFEFYAGPYFVLRDLGWRFFSTDPRPVISLALTGLFGLVWLGVCIRQFVRPLRFEVAAALIFAAYLLCSRTIHPWYLGGILCLLPFLAPRWRWPWLWLAAGAWGTYFFYVDGTYWPFVWVGWLGWAALSGIALLTWPSLKWRIDHIVQPLLRRRAAWKTWQILPALAGLESPHILDLGASEGYVTEALAVRLRHPSFTLADVADRFRVPFPQMTYDGIRLPFPNAHFDASIATYALHHCADPLATLTEMARVSRYRVVLLESWGRTHLLRLLLAAVDVTANALRGGSWTERVRYRSIPEWSALAGASGLHLVRSTDLGGLFHAKLLLEFEPLHHRTVKILPDPDDSPL